MTPVNVPLTTDSTPQVSIDVELHDGTPAHIRTVRPDDEPALSAMLAGLPAEERVAIAGWSTDTLERLAATIANARDDEGQALVASSLEGDVVGVGRWMRMPRIDDELARAEAWVAVAHVDHRDGLATRLLEQVARSVKAAGIDELVGEVDERNAGILATYLNLGFANDARSYEHATQVHLRLDFDDAYLRRSDLRHRDGGAASLQAMLHPASVSVVGVSASGKGIGAAIVGTLVAGEYGGRLDVIGRRDGTVHGITITRAATGALSAVDLAVICVPAAGVLDAVGEVLVAGAQVVCVISAGFAEASPEGGAQQQLLHDLVRSHGARLVGPNCLGIARPSIGLDTTFARAPFAPGHLACGSHSGAVLLALRELAEARGFGFSSVVSLGNRADVGTTDLLEVWEDDELTRGIVLYLESLADARRFTRVAARVGRARPIVVLHGGSTDAGVRAAGSHTAALATSHAVADAVFADAGVLVADGIGQLADIVAYLELAPLTAGRRLAIVTNGGGVGVLAADAAAAGGLSIAELSETTQAKLRAALPPAASVDDPIDLLGSATAPQYASAIHAVLLDANVDAVLVLHTATSTTPTQVVVEAIASAVDAAAVDDPSTTARPVMVTLLAHDAPARIDTQSRSIPVYPTPEAAVTTYARVSAHVRQRELARPTPVAVTQIDADAVRRVLDAHPAGDDGWLTAQACGEVLTAAGIPTPVSEFADDPIHAQAVAVQIGFPVALKTVGATSAVHKRAQGGVWLNLRDLDQVRDAAAQAGGRVLVQAMAPAGAELIIGIARSTSAGSLIGLGPGGSGVERTADMSFRLIPTNERALDDLLARHPVRSRLTDDAARAAVRGVLLRVAALAAAFPQLCEVDLNPLVVNADGCSAVDVRIRCAAPDAVGLG